MVRLIVRVMEEEEEIEPQDRPDPYSSFSEPSGRQKTQLAWFQAVQNTQISRDKLHFVSVGTSVYVVISKSREGAAQPAGDERGFIRFGKLVILRQTTFTNETTNYTSVLMDGYYGKSDNWHLDLFQTAEKHQVALHHPLHHSWPFWVFRSLTRIVGDYWRTEMVGPILWQGFICTHIHTHTYSIYI